MSRLARVIVVLVFVLNAGVALSQALSGLARIDAQNSFIADTRSGAAMELFLSQGVPYRLFTLADPDRLVLDFREVDWTGLSPERFEQARDVAGVRFGGFRPGWSRMVIDLARPLKVEKADMRVSEESGKARLTVLLEQVSREEFEAASIPPSHSPWDTPPPPRVKKSDNGRLTVVIDPGHGGIDPGAERAGEVEKDLVLLLAFDLRDALLRVDGVDVVMTREDDRFVSLERRVTIAHQAGADAFISLHADTLTEGRAHGAQIYTLSEQASDEASALLAERHNRADMLAGIDLSESDDVVAGVLLDLARTETQPRSEALGRALVTALEKNSVPLNRRPMRHAAFSVLKAADFPSVLVEIGFLSSDRDLTNLSDPLWRRKAAAALRDGVQAWLIEDEALHDLLRQ